MRGILILAMVALTVAAVPAAAGDAGAASMEGEKDLLPPADDFEYVEGPGFGLSGSDAGDVPDEYARDTSDYMVGTVQVQVVFLESDGSREPETEDWTATRKGTVLQEIEEGLGFWESEAPARLSFQGETSGTTVQTGMEPIRNNGTTGGPCTNQWVWVHDAMEQLGYVSEDQDCDDDGFVLDAYFATRSFAHDLRNAHDTDWAYTIFVVDSLNDDDGQFADGDFAYAYRSGPFTVMTYDNDGWGIDRMNKVTAHETGHIFGASDEYNDIPESWGYLWEEDDDGSGCIMDGNNGDCVSQGTAGQVGWRDTDGDGAPDPVDTEPVVDRTAFSGPDGYTDDPTLDFSGVAGDDPYPAHDNFTDQGYHSISVNDVTDVLWSVDGGAASSTSTDVPDPHQAPWGFATSSLAEGTYQVDVWSRNQVGAEDGDPVTRHVTVDTTPPTTGIEHPAPGWIYLARLAYAGNPSEPGDGETPVVTGNVLHVNATADDEAPISHVDVVIDGDHVHRDEEAPYRVNVVLDPLTSGAPGTHTLEVEAVDAAGNAASATQDYLVPPDPDPFLDASAPTPDGRRSGAPTILHGPGFR